MQVQINEDTSAVLQFMQANIPASRLVGVAASLPLMAKLLWDGCPQEPCQEPYMVVVKPDCDPSLSDATG